jgi:Tfp pilus assembly protein PilN
VNPVVLVSLISGAVILIPSAITALWKWSRAVEDRAYERARNEALLREAQATISQKDSELETVKSQRDAALIEQTRLHGVIATLQRALDRMPAEGTA